MTTVWPMGQMTATPISRRQTCLAASVVSPMGETTYAESALHYANTTPDVRRGSE